MAKYTLFIDESGEAGIANVRSSASGGASPYMTLGAVLIPNVLHSKVTEKLALITKRFDKKNLHCNRLRHEQKVRYSKVVNTFKVKCFGIISLKETLGSYKEDISSDSSKYYNKCAQYLLERVGAFLKQHEIPSNALDIVFEEGNFKYNALRNLLRACQQNPSHPSVSLLRYIDVDRIQAVKKADDPLLQVADLVAHSLYRCVDKTNGNYRIAESRYLFEIRKKFHHDTKTGRIDGHGIKAVHSLKQLGLDDEMLSFLENLSVK